MAKENIYGQMEIIMKGAIIMEKRMEWANFIINLKIMFIKVFGKMEVQYNHLFNNFRENNEIKIVIFIIYIIVAT